MTEWWCEHAWLGDRVADAVRITATDGVIDALEPDSAPGGQRLRGLVIPGLANAHSHAFHRALRSHTQRGGGSFWTWRESMYRIAERLTPQSYLELARAVIGADLPGDAHWHGLDGFLTRSGPHEVRFTHALLLREGKVTAAGDLDSTLTEDALSHTFGLPLRLSRDEGRYAARRR